MSDTNLPSGTGGDEALSVEGGADAISDLLKDPVTDLSEEDQGETGKTEEVQAEGEQPEAEATEDEPTEETTDEEKDGPQGYESGKFASDTANVRLKDGSVISVQDLKRGYLAQSSFTRGTQENAKERETLASQRAEVEQYARNLLAQRDFLLQASQQFLPQPPSESLLDTSSPSYDPLRYVAQKAEYDKRIGTLSELQQVSQAEQARMAQEQQRQFLEARGQEARKLIEVMPELKKPEVREKFWSETVDTMAEYGFSTEELNGAIDHRFYKVYRDLAAYRRARKNAPVAKQSVQSKPVLTGQKRMDPKAKSSRDQQARNEQLRKTGDFDAGVRALETLDL